MYTHTLMLMKNSFKNVKYCVLILMMHIKEWAAFTVKRWFYNPCYIYTNVKNKCSYVVSFWDTKLLRLILFTHHENRGKLLIQRILYIIYYLFQNIPRLISLQPETSIFFHILYSGQHNVYSYWVCYAISLFMYVFMLDFFIHEVLLNNNEEIMSFVLKYFLFLNETENVKDKKDTAYIFKILLSY